MHDQKISRRLLRDEAHDAIRDAILDGTLSPGEQLDDARLQQWLGISRTPIREAIFALQLEGFVETAAQSYTRVVNPDREEVVYAIQTVGAMFGGVLRTVVPSLDDQAQSAILDLVARAEVAIVERDAREHMDVTVQFYNTLIELCSNTILRRVAAWAVTSLSFRYRITVDERTPNWEMLTAGWSRMKTGIAARDPLGAALACEEMHLLPGGETDWAPAVWRG
jgi:DNA-binding GntR family transcriptional regulator